MSASPPPAAVARAHTLQRIAVHALDLADRAREALPRAEGDDAVYLRACAQEADSVAERLASAPGYRA